MSAPAWGAIALAAAGMHALVISLVHVHAAELDAPAPEPKKQAPASLVSYSCELEAAAAAAVGLAVCNSPLVADPGTCESHALNQHRLDYLDCKRPPEPVSVAMVDLDKIKPLPILPVKPVDDIVAAELLDKEIQKKVEQAQKRIARPAMSGQVVEITRPQVESQPDKARYLSEYDSDVKKQTVARGSTEKMVERPSPKELPVTENPPEKREELTSKPPDEATAENQDRATENPGTKGEGKGKNKLAMRGLGSADRRPSEAREAGMRNGNQRISEDGFESRRGDGMRRSERSEMQPQGGGGGDGGDTKRVPDLKPSEKTIARAVGGGSVDKLDNVESGEFTALRSRKWKFASFFNRLKRRVAQNWHPEQVYLRRDPTGKVYGQKDRITVLRISLTRSGALAKVFVQKQSGVDFLDDEAIRAFREAGPFPNPPSALVEDGLITFSFGFHFQIGGRSGSWRIFRYR